MVRWHGDEAQRSRLHHAAEDAKSGDQAKGRGAGRGSHTDTAAVEWRNGMIHQVARDRLN